MIIAEIIFEENERMYKSINIEEELLIPLARETIFPKYLSPDFLSYILNFSKDFEFDDLLELAKTAIKNPH